jgi:hypothetical protein
MIMEEEEGEEGKKKKIVFYCIWKEGRKHCETEREVPSSTLLDG